MNRRWAYVWAAAPSVLVVAANSLVTWRTDVRTTTLLSEPAGTYGFPVYAGVFSHLGVALWVAAAAVALFAAWVGRRQAPAGARFLRDAGLLTLLLAADDIFLFHESVLPTHVSLPELVMLDLEGLLAVALLIRHRRFVLADGRGLLALAAAGFGLSLAADVWDPSGLDVLVEDALKILGIGAWLAFLSVRAADVVRSGVARHTRP